MLSYITWTADPVLIHLGPIAIRWYSLMFAIGFIVGYEIVARMFRHEGAPERWLGILLLWTIAGTVIGARLGHVFFYEWDVYRQDPISILYVWQGALQVTAAPSASFWLSSSSRYSPHAEAPVDF